jgi:hypothetical protein
MSCSFFQQNLFLRRNQIVHKGSALILLLLLNSFKPTQTLMHKLSLYNKVFKIQNGGIIKMKFHNQQAFLSGLITDHLEE